MTKFTVTMKEVGAWEDHYMKVFQNEKAAITHAENLADENPNQLVFVSFYRESDGTLAYINRGGADVTGKSWTDVE